MNKSNTIFLMILFLIFACGSALFLTPEVLAQDNPPAGESVSEEELIPEEENTENSEEPSEPDEAPEEESEVQVWSGIDEDQAEILNLIFGEMTNTGQTLSGWFTEGDHTPCSWSGITCENDRITELSFENAGFFTTFPEAVLKLRDLKTLRMNNTLIFGPLPDTLFSDLPMLETLELSGNYFTGEIPGLPAAFEAYPMLSSITISGNLANDSGKDQLLGRPEYADTAIFQADPQIFSGADMNPGLDGNIPSDWDRLPGLYQIDLSGNTLTGSVPDSFAQLPLAALDLSNNGEGLEISAMLYDDLASSGYPGIVLAGLIPPEPTEEPVYEEPTEEPVYEIPTGEPVYEAPTEEPVYEIPTEEPVYEVPTEEPVYELPTEEPAYEAPTEEPVYEVPTEESVYEIPTEEPVYEEPTEEPVYEVPTEEPVYEVPTEEPTAEQRVEDPGFRWIDPPVDLRDRPTEIPAPPQPPEPVFEPTEIPQWYTPTAIPWQQPVYPTQDVQPGPYYPPADPYYPTAAPYYPPADPYYPPYYVPTETPYPYPGSVPYFPTEVSGPVGPGPEPVRDEGASMGFTYMTAEMTGNSIPMTWRNTGMVSYSINYLDSNDTLFPAFAMEWTPASELCNESVCKASVTDIPRELLSGGTFSLQLRAQDPSGRTIISDPIKMQVSLPEPTPTPVPEEHSSGFGSFLRWLFGPIIRLFSGH